MKNIRVGLINVCKNCLRNAGILFICLAIFPVYSFGQKICTNPPTLSLSATSGTTCSITPITVTGNVFGGSATRVTISSNGGGSVTPASATASPFSFTYQPAASDAGKSVVITITTNNPLKSPCKAAKETYQLTVSSGLSAPVIENITQPACTVSTGTVQLSGLPSTGWTLTISPSGTNIEGSGSTTQVTLPPGTYTFTVSVSSACSSQASPPAVINSQPVSPPPPAPGTITPPTCSLATGSVVLGNLPANGIWTITRYPGTIQTSGTGTSSLISALPPGTYNFSVSSATGCESGLSSNVTIPASPSNPLPPVIGKITQPTVEIPTGSVEITGLPTPGTWTLIMLPGEVGYGGTGSSFTITSLVAGTYKFKVMNSSGCLSNESDSVVLKQPFKPALVITDPAPVCYPATVDITASEITSGSSPGLTFTYWATSDTTVGYKTPHSATDGIYYIMGTTSSGLFDIKPVHVTVKHPPVVNAGHDQSLSFQFSTTLNATLGTDESGTWYADTANISFTDITDPHTSVSNLYTGSNKLYWIVTNKVCPADTGAVTILVGGLKIPTLITPNGDALNEYFIISGIENLGRSGLTVFDRRGKLVFQNDNYDNNWNGIDYNHNPLPNDTYFFELKSYNGKSFKGYIVVRR